MIVYRHIRIDKNEPFYIGIGNRLERAYRKDGRNDIWNKIIAKTDYKVQILFDDVNEEFAKNKEKELIKLYGRIHYNDGTLANLTEGGDNIECPQSKRDKLRLANLGKKHTQETKDKISRNKKGKKHSEQSKKNMGLSKIGLKRSEETKKKLSEIAFKNKNSFDYNIYNFYHVKSGIEESMTRSDFEKKYNLPISTMSCLINGKHNIRLGWVLKDKVSDDIIFRIKNDLGTSFRFDIATFKNVKTGEEITDYYSFFIKKNNMVRSLMDKVIKGKRNHHKRWKVINFKKQKNNASISD
jgi:predicted transcriptional regulator